MGQLQTVVGGRTRFLQLPRRRYDRSIGDRWGRALSNASVCRCVPGDAPGCASTTADLLGTCAEATKSSTFMRDGPLAPVPAPEALRVPGPELGEAVSDGDSSRAAALQKTIATGVEPVLEVARFERAAE